MTNGETGVGVRQSWTQGQLLPFPGCVTLERSVYLSEPFPPHLPQGGVILLGSPHCGQVRMKGSVDRKPCVDQEEVRVANYTPASHLPPTHPRWEGPALPCPPCRPQRALAPRDCGSSGRLEEEGAESECRISIYHWRPHI